MNTIIAILTLTCLAAAQGDTWSRWRGADGTGYAANAKPPIRWSEESNIRWKTPIDGKGISTPVVWGDRLYLTTAVVTVRVGKPKSQAEQDRSAAPLPTRIHEFVVMAISRTDGKIIWRKKVNELVPHEGGHSTNSQASISPVTDGEFLFVSFGSHGLYCLDMDGETVWEKQLGTMRTRRQYGEGSSPALHGETLVINWDHEGDSFIAALDRQTGKERWRKRRQEVTSWSTPAIVEVDGKLQVIINATTASRGYDIKTGKVLWSLGGMTVNCIPSPIVKDGMAYVMSGYRGKMLQAIRLSGARGDLAEKDNLVWDHRRSTSYVPSAALCKGRLYFLRGNSGVLTCLDAKSGKLHYEGKKIGLRSVYSSPTGAGQHLFITSRGGVTKVIKLGDEFEEVASNRLDDEVDASMVIVDDAIYLRGRKSLYCISRDSK